VVWPHSTSNINDHMVCCAATAWDSGETAQPSCTCLLCFIRHTVQPTNTHTQGGTSRQWHPLSKLLKGGIWYMSHTPPAARPAAQPRECSYSSTAPPLSAQEHSTAVVQEGGCSDVCLHSLAARLLGVATPQATHTLHAAPALLHPAPRHTSDAHTPENLSSCTRCHANAAAVVGSLRA